MFEVKTLMDNVFLFQSSYWQLNSGCVRDKEGWAVIDPGFSTAEMERIRDFVGEKGENEKGYLIYTHSDFDHITGEPYFPQAKKVAQSNFELCSKDKQVAHLKEADEVHQLERPEFIFPSPDITFDEKLDLELKEETISLIAAPGHTRDSLFVILKNKGVMFSGDTLSNIEFPLIFFSGEKYLETLKMAECLIDRYDIRCVVPGHGSDAQGKKEILKRIKDDQQYLNDLMGQIEDYFYMGLATMEIKSVLREVRYRGDYIGAELMPVHEKNIELAINEVGDNL